MAKKKSTVPLPKMDDVPSRKKRAKKIIDKLKSTYSVRKRTALDHIDPLQMVVATILSAQCTDKQVNIVTPALFKRYKTAADYADTDVEELEGLIKPTGFYHNKAKNIIACCKKLRDDYNSKVPREMAELTKLPGIGRKTANVIKYAVWGDNDGIAVDTHVGRLSRRLGLSHNTDAEKVELDLLEVTPEDSRGDFSWLIIQHGRNICDARKPDCPNCIIASLCPSAGKAEGIK